MQKGKREKKSTKKLLKIKQLLFVYKINLVSLHT